jgi:small subunit ribosomal protein S21
MAFIKVKDGERIDNALRRFRKAVDKSGVMADLKKHEYFEKPSVKKKRKQAAARKRAARDARAESRGDSRQD